MGLTPESEPSGNESLSEERAWVDSAELKHAIKGWRFPRPIIDRIYDSIDKLSSSGFLSPADPIVTGSNLEKFVDDVFKYVVGFPFTELSSEEKREVDRIREQHFPNLKR